MGTFVKEGVCVPRTGHDWDYMEFEDEFVGAHDLIERASGVKCAPESVILGVTYREERDYYDDYLRKYRHDTGRTWPPVFRVAIRVDAEPLSETECAEFWGRFESWRHARVEKRKRLRAERENEIQHGEKT